MEQVLEEEVNDLIDEIRQNIKRGENVCIPDVFYPVMINCIFHLLIGNRIPLADRERAKVGSSNVQVKNSKTLNLFLFQGNRKNFDEISKINGCHWTFVGYHAFH